MGTLFYLITFINNDSITNKNKWDDMNHAAIMKNKT